MEKEIKKIIFKELKKRNKKINKLWDFITVKFFLNQRRHDLAYELNNEYKLLWDNLGEELQKKLIINRTILKIRPALVKLTLTIATCGIFYLIELIYKYIENKKVIAYVTSESFTNICRTLYEAIEFKNQNEETFETVKDIDNSNIKKYEGVEEIDNYTIIKTLIILFLVILLIYILSL